MVKFFVKARRIKPDYIGLFLNNTLVKSSQESVYFLDPYDGYVEKYQKIISVDQWLSLIEEWVEYFGFEMDQETILGCKLKSK